MSTDERERAEFVRWYKEHQGHGLVSDLEFEIWQAGVEVGAQRVARQTEPTDETLIDLAQEECKDFRWPSSALKIMRAALAATPTPAQPVAWSPLIYWRPRQTEQVVKITRTPQPEHGFTEPLFAAAPPQAAAQAPAQQVLYQENFVHVVPGEEPCEFCGGTGAGSGPQEFCDPCDGTGRKPWNSAKYRRAVEAKEAAELNLAAAAPPQAAAQAPAAQPFTDEQIDAACGPCEDHDRARYYRRQFIAEFRRVYDALAAPAQAAQPERSCDKIAAALRECLPLVAALAAGMEADGEDAAAALATTLVRVSEKRLAEYAAQAAHSAPVAWISVSERLPERHQPVALLAADRWENVGGDWDRNVQAAGYLEDYGSGPFWSIGGYGANTLESFTHWMPLPQTTRPNEPELGAGAQGKEER